MKEYYTQRAAIKGTLMITRATYISDKSIDEACTPGLWSEEQMAAWKEVTDVVHEKMCFNYCQMWAIGRAAEIPVLQTRGLEYVSSSTTPGAEGSPAPRVLIESEIVQYISDYAQAARNAIKAGFDGVEIHGANGYLVDQFTQDTCNKRTDRWGGSVENRARFAIEVTKAVADAIGADRTAIRLSPYSTFQGMRMQNAKDQFTYLVEQLKKIRPSYLHIVQPRISGADDMEDELRAPDEAPFIPQLWGNTSPLLVAGGFTPESAEKLLEDSLYRDQEVVVVFGRYFISNPDLPFRAKHNIQLAKYDRSTFYTPMQAKGYTDYSCSLEYLKGEQIVQG
ncbi:Chanoclavine-I aldehyde reductase [Neonectria ditissima]|uniref:Chanoclavine-I aldehyde reductase n=1 Tax=Neonectria ditissima TaxID=78410 RepID=A0A0P7B504_9HYPO|nr:Chanoclavine-I aldehyde reductase [Neonectria ditissima]